MARAEASAWLQKDLVPQPSCIEGRKPGLGHRRDAKKCLNQWLYHCESSFTLFLPQKYLRHCRAFHDIKLVRGAGGLEGHHDVERRGADARHRARAVQHRLVPYPFSF